MLGVTEAPRSWATTLLREFADQQGVADTHDKTYVGVFFGSRRHREPVLRWRGPPRSSCIGCGGCMVGCRFNAKNTLDKNYLYFAEKRGEDHARATWSTLAARGRTAQTATRSRPSARGRWVLKQRRQITARDVVLAASALGTNQLLRLPRQGLAAARLASAWATSCARTREALLAVTAADRNLDFTERVAITGSIYPDPDTHIETVTYGAGGD